MPVKRIDQLFHRLRRYIRFLLTETYGWQVDQVGRLQSKLPANTDEMLGACSALVLTAYRYGYTVCTSVYLHQVQPQKIWGVANTWKPGSRPLKQQALIV